MNADTVEILLESIRVAVFALALLRLSTVGRRRTELPQPGWFLIVTGFALLLFGSVIGVLEHFEAIGPFPISGGAATQVLLEQGFGFLGGFVLIVAGLFAWIPNITSVAQLRTTERTNQALLKAFPDLISRIGRDRIYQWVHVPADFHPVWGSENPVGRTLQEMLPAPLAEKAVTCHEAAFATGQSRTYEYTATIEGRMCYREARVVPLSDDCVLVIARDITVRKQTEQMLQRYTEDLELARTRHQKQAFELKRQAEELKVAQAHAEQASRAKSEFLAHMSHEIRTPMTAILGYADILMEGTSESEGMNAALTIRRNGEYLLAVINDILDLSKIEAGKLTIEKTSCCPGSLATDVAALMRVRAEAKGLPLEVQFEGPTPEQIVTDPIRLRQILINLMGNAIKFTEIGLVRLVVRLREAEGPTPRLQFEVTDTGRGIPKDQIRRVFRPFSQATGTGGPPVAGTGLGLTISKRLAEMLGGAITVQSVLGQGSTFTLTIPTGPLDRQRLFRCSAETGQQALPSDQGPPPRQKLDGHILLVEDGPDNQRLISYVLRRAGARVSIAEDGQRAVDMVLGAHFGRRQGDVDESFDLVLMDLQMPVMDGYEATRTLRQQGFRGPIIALTAHAMPTESQRCLEAGCDGFATKPIDREQLISLIRQHLGPPQSAADPLVTTV
jgi:signal transduction histidine kinase